MTRQESTRLRKLAVVWGGVPSLAQALQLHRSTLYRYMGGKLEVPRSTAISLNYLAEHKGVPIPFQSIPPLDEHIRKFLDSHFNRQLNRSTTT